MSLLAGGGVLSRSRRVGRGRSWGVTGRGRCRGVLGRGRCRGVLSGGWSRGVLGRGRCWGILGRGRGWGIGSNRGGGGSIGLSLGVLSCSLIGDLSNISTVTVDGVGHLLESAIGKCDVVRTTGGISLPGLFLTVVVAGVVILHGPVEGVLGGLIGVLWGSRGVARGVRGGCSGGNSQEGGNG